MKFNLFTGSFLLYAILLANFACKKEHQGVQPMNKWETIPTPYYGKPLDLQFINADTGYILGYNNKVPILIKTMDGGKSWKTITFSSQFLRDTSDGIISYIYVSPFNADILFSGFHNLVRSTDGGYHWEIIQKNTRINPADMHFFNLWNGVVLYSSRIYTTTDSGFTWIQASYPQAESGVGYLRFPSNRVGFAVVTRIIEAGNGYYFIPVIIKSTDEGATWNVAATLNYPFNSILDMDFVNDTMGYLIKTFGSGEGDNPYPDPKDAEMLKTTDGGKTWLMVNNNIPAGYEAMHFINESEGFLFLGTIYHTNDGGISWKKVDGPSIYPGNKYCFPNDHLLYTVDANGNLLKLIF